ncbi:MAG TPA: shikimate kinase [Thermoanaerobaculia bacterium]|nr:shikimate kinase [Thermoanaerobaculia bacterium]
MRVFLTGFKGSGKTTVGRLISDRLELPYIDLDTEIERRAGLSVKEIFERGGEALFRRLEHEALAAAVARPDAVIATGGGTVAQEPNLPLVEAAGVSVWLDPPFSLISERIGGLGKEDRPLFQTESQALELYRRRLDAYRRADLRLAVEPGEEPEVVAARIALLLEGGA